MKKMGKLSIAAILCAATVLTAGFTTVYASEAAEGQPQTTEIAIDEIMDDIGNNVETRPLEEGDKWAIDLIDATEKNGELAGGYQLLDYNLENQGKLYMNDGSKIVIKAFNYKEELQDMATWADNACAMIKIKNITSACETVFSEPQKTKICGYDAIMYDCDIIQYKFIDETTKEVYDTYKGRNYFFYSDKNAYSIMFDTNDETWNSELANFESFVDSLVVDGKANESGSSASVIVAVCVGAIVVVGAVIVLAIGKKKKKAE